MTLTQKILGISLGGIVVSVALTLFTGMVVYQANQNANDFTPPQPAIALGLTLVKTTSHALTPLIEAQDINSVRSIVATTVTFNPEIIYGAYLDEDLVPWALATPSKPQGIPESLDSLADENSLWGSELQEPGHLKTHLNEQAVTLFASPIIIDNEFKGAVYFATETPPAPPQATLPKKLFGAAIILLFLLTATAITCTHLAQRVTRTLTQSVAAIEKSICQALSTHLLEPITASNAAPLTFTYNQLAQQWNTHAEEQQLLTQATLKAASASTPVAAALAITQTLYDYTHASIIVLLVTDQNNQEHIYLLEKGESNEEGETENTASLSPELNTLIERTLTAFKQQAKPANLQTGDVLCNQQVTVFALPIIANTHKQEGSILIINEVDAQQRQATPMPSEKFTRQLGQLLCAALSRITENNSLKTQLAKLKQDNQTTRDSLESRNNDLSNLMRNLHEGMLIITEHGLIDDHYSQKLELILNTKITPGEHYKELLFTNTGLSSAQINQITCAIDTTLGSQELMYAFNSHLLCEELNIIDPNGSNKTLLTHWDPIIDKGVITKLMLTISDTTHQDALERTTRAQKEELELVGQVLKVNTQKFEELMHYTQNTLNRNIKLIRNYEHSDQLDFDALFHNIHNIKKEARTQGLTHLTQSLHTIESRYDAIRKKLDNTWKVADLLSDLQIITTKIERYKHINHDILKRTDATTAPQLSKEQLYTIASELKNLKPSISGRNGLASLAAIENILLDATTLDIVLLANQRLDLLADIAEPLDKTKPSIYTPSNDFRILNKLKSSITEVLDQIFRNAIYHSFESKEERKNLGKDSSGIITLKISEKSSHLVIRITDDGKGLNIKRLAEKGAHKGQITPAETKNINTVAQLLFNPQVYTPSSPSIDSSYRYGIAQVKSTLEEIGGNASVEVLSPCLEGYCEIAIELTLPANLYTQVPNSVNRHIKAAG